MTVATFLPTERVSSYVLLAVRRKLICWYSCGVTEIHSVLVISGRLRFTQLQSHRFFSLFIHRFDTETYGFDPDETTFSVPSHEVYRFLSLSFNT